jgi:anti-sigma regulatory factor (Ser/Thr protein kinase)
MKIHLPNSAFLGNIDPFLGSFNPKNPRVFQITSNEKWVSVHPVVLCMLASIGIEVSPENITCNITAKTKHYFERMRLYNFFGFDSKIQVTEHDPSGRFIPLTQIKTSEELSDFIREMIPLLHLSSEHTDSIKYIVSELGRNVLEHANSTNGMILCAQYYPKSNTIRMGIVDRGVGIKKTINYSHYAKNDLQAIGLALAPGITGTTKKDGGTEQNAGAGLFFIKSMALVNRSFFMIYTGNAMYKLLRHAKSRQPKMYADPFSDKHSEGDAYPYWQGTTIGVDINLNQTTEFVILLELIRQTYSTAVRERRKKRFRKPTFI